jgi:AhpD family alkylhydroperoxidase
MRLSVLDHGHRRRAKLFLRFTSALSRVDSPDMPKMLLYRPEFFARPLLDLTAEAMRGPSYWTAAEREYLAMCTARRNQCPFCVDTHAELTRIAGDGALDPDDPTSARPELLAVRDFLAGTPDRADATGVAGLPEHAVLEALRVDLVFGIVNRLANAFGFTLREGQLHSGTRALHRFGYRFPGFLLAGGETADEGDAVENLRRAVPDAPFPGPWEPYVTAVRDASHEITDGDVGRLIAAGHTEDQIFEVTVAAAAGAALRDFDAGRRALERAVENGGGRSSSGMSINE